MKLKYSTVHWNRYAPHADNIKPDTEIRVIDENTLEVDGERYEFPADGVLDPPRTMDGPDNSIATQTGGAILEAHRDENGVLCATVRRYYDQQSWQSWWKPDYEEVLPCE